MAVEGRVGNASAVGAGACRGIDAACPVPTHATEATGSDRAGVVVKAVIGKEITSRSD